MSYIDSMFGQGSRVHVALILVLFAIVSGGFNCIYWHLPTPTLVKFVAIVACIPLLLYGRPMVRLNFQVQAFLLAFLPFLSAAYSHFAYGQPLIGSISVTLPSLVWLFYFVLHRTQLNEGSIVKAFFYISLFVLAVQVVQQFTYPHIMFGVRHLELIEEGKDFVSMRNGLWRFHIGNNAYFTCFVLFFLWHNVNMRPMENTLLLVGLLLVSVYFTLTRQVIFATMLTLLVSYLLRIGRMKVWIVMAGALFIAVLYWFSDTLFGEFAEMTEEELSEKYIRFIAADYFWKYTFSSPMVMLTGHGLPYSGSYQDFWNDLQNVYHFYVSDVGFIGMMWQFGVPYVLVCFHVLYKVFFKFRNQVPTYIRLFVTFTTVMSFMIFPMSEIVTYLIWCFVLYICDMYINDEFADEDEEASGDEEVNLLTAQQGGMV